MPERGEAINLLVGCILGEMRKNRLRVLLAENNITAKDLADKIGRQAQTLRRYVRHESEPPFTIAEKIAEALGVSLDDVLGVEDAAITPTHKRRMLPVYGSVQGGDGFDITDVREPIDSIEAPPALLNSVDAYAVYVTGDSMSPRFNAGEIVFVMPGKPVTPNDSVVVQFSDLKTDQAVIKTFKNMDENKLFLSQFNPSKSLTYKRSEIKSIHKIIGTMI
tara:strand:+ start:257 stop:916 length:660 start_codon:yes stop_codon:yes gene_type:complete